MSRLIVGAYFLPGEAGSLALLMPSARGFVVTLPADNLQAESSINSGDSLLHFLDRLSGFPINSGALTGGMPPLSGRLIHNRSRSANCCILSPEIPEIQPRYTHRVFQVEVIDGVLRQQLPRQGRLAALTRAGQRHDPASLQGGTDGGEVIRSFDHADRIP